MVPFKMLVCKGWIPEEVPTVCSLEEVISLCFHSQKNLLKPVSHLVTPAKTVQVGFLYSVTRNLSTSQCEIMVFAGHSL